MLWPVIACKRKKNLIHFNAYKRKNSRQTIREFFLLTVQTRCFQCIVRISHSCPFALFFISWHLWHFSLIFSVFRVLDHWPYHGYFKITWQAAYFSPGFSSKHCLGHKKVNKDTHQNLPNRTVLEDASCKEWLVGFYRTHNLQRSSAVEPKESKTFFLPLEFPQQRWTGLANF